MPPRLTPRGGRVIAWMVLALTCLWVGRRTLASAALGGRTAALAEMTRVADSTAGLRVAQARVLWAAQQRTDTVFVAYGAKVARTRAVIAAIPRTVRDSMPPVVATALDACDALAADAAALTGVLLSERAAARELFRLDTLAIDGLKAQVVVLRTEVQRLERRPAWWQVVLGGVGTAAVAFVVGRAV